MAASNSQLSPAVTVYESGGVFIERVCVKLKGTRQGKCVGMGT